MKFRVGLLAGVSVFGIFGATVSHAADLTPPPPPPQYVEVVDAEPSCLYARADVGGSFHQRPTVTKAGASATGEVLKDHAFIEAGAGCKVTDIMRVEVTGGYRFKGSLKDDASGLDADLETYTGFVNAFWDITNYNGFTPYLGAGVGVAYHRLTNVTLPGGSSNGNRADLAYSFSAGVSYDISSNLLLDIGYRYVNL
ncbi:MAG TPA: porin family protein, partial [Rhizobiales bacterium]|nr:porin family protein [Hyphomicrobiales bacterium]